MVWDRTLVVNSSDTSRGHPAVRTKGKHRHIHSRFASRSYQQKFLCFFFKKKILLLQSDIRMMNHIIIFNFMLFINHYISTLCKEMMNPIVVVHKSASRVTAIRAMDSIGHIIIITLSKLWPQRVATVQGRVRTATIHLH